MERIQVELRQWRVSGDVDDAACDNGGEDEDEKEGRLWNESMGDLWICNFTKLGQEMIDFMDLHTAAESNKRFNWKLKISTMSASWRTGNEGGRCDWAVSWDNTFRGTHENFTISYYSSATHKNPLKPSFFNQLELGSSTIKLLQKPEA